MKPEGARLHKADYVVEGMPFKMAVALVRNYHYAQGAANTAIYRHGLFHRDNAMEPLGCALWMPPAIGTRDSLSEDGTKQVLTLSRLVIVPDMPTNAASFLLASSINLIRKDRRFDILVTYADEGQGHTGAIYRATNWEYVGVNTGGPIWLDSEGRMVANKTTGNGRTKAQMESLGYTNTGKTRKHKFVMRLS